MKVGEDVEVLATECGDPVLVRQGKVIASTFHPELTTDLRVHRLFMDMVRTSEPSSSHQAEYF